MNIMISQTIVGSRYKCEVCFNFNFVSNAINTVQGFMNQLTPSVYLVKGMRKTIKQKLAVETNQTVMPVQLKVSS